MKRTTSTKPAAAPIRCAIYTRKSTEEGLELEFNSLDAQRESAEAYIASQKQEGWSCLPGRYDDGGFTGGNMERPALKRLLADIQAEKVDCVIVYKVDRLSRSLLDFARLVEVFEKRNVSFVSVTQQFNTATSMGRLVLNVLLSFAQFEREIIGERIRDKIAATRRKGKWSGGYPVLGYDVDRSNGSPRLIPNAKEAARVRDIFKLYLSLGSLLPVVNELIRRGWRNKEWSTKKGAAKGGRPFDKGTLYALLTNPLYVGKIKHKADLFQGEHELIVDAETFQKVQGTLQRNGRSGGVTVRNRHGALLKGLLFCKGCERAMVHSFSTKGERRYRYYTCTRAIKNGRPARQQLIQNRPEGVDIGARSHVLAPTGGLFRSHVTRGSQHMLAERRARRNVQPLGQAEVADLWLKMSRGIRADAARRDPMPGVTTNQEHVSGFQFAVDDAALGGSVNGAGQHLDQLGGLSRGLGPRADPVLQVAAVEVLHREKGVPVVFADLEDLNQVGVLQTGNGFNLGLEASPLRRRGVPARQQHFQRDQPLQAGLTRLVDHAHAAAAQFAEDLIAWNARKSVPTRMMGGRWRVGDRCSGPL
jgi:DNA invertase Pin-like site-specific DNA recombinase